MPKFKRAEADGLVEEFIQKSLAGVSESKNIVPVLLAQTEKDAARVKKKMSKWVEARSGTIVADRLPCYEISNDIDIKEIISKGIPWEKEIHIPVRSCWKNGQPPTGPQDLESITPSKSLLTELRCLAQRANVLQKLALQVYDLVVSIEPSIKEGVEQPIVLATMKAVFLDFRQAVRPMQNLMSDYLLARSTREEKYYRNFLASGTYNSVLAFDYLVWHRLHRCHGALAQMIIYFQTLIQNYSEHIVKYANDKEHSAESMYIS
eukprot:TRINITY_DN13630_c0_g1_i1.p1 TRINITY_DN13630_c0_g1~~TRINITY_DN13630_c0_g1_i1.p1  ORF type:complete len:263 (+),score=36.09 TRINITY_DN13630_c0_g1_i1:42-830(+)